VATELDIANGALAHVGEPPIADFNGTSAKAVACRQHFAKARDAVLRLAWWNFATAWAYPARDPIDSVGPLAKRFVLPVDCITVRSVDGLTDDQWAVESGKVTLAGATVEQLVLATNADTPRICYTRRVETVAVWDALFVTTMEFYLGSFIVPQLGRDALLGPSLRKEGDEWLENASGVDAREKATSQISRDTSWVTARRK
jgi:hypothetical protein